MWADVETSSDFLNFGETAELVADLLKDRAMLPLSVGVFGGWGAGKSTLLQLLEAQVAGRDEFLIVKFDAWLYQGYDDARAALMEVIAAQLAAQADADQGLVEKIARLTKRVNYLRLAGLAADAGLMAATGGLGLGMASTAIGLGQRLFSGEGTAEDAEEIRSAAHNTIGTASSLWKEDPGRETSPQKEISALRAEYAEVISKLDKTLVVFIDNLDRCLPRNAIHTLEAIRLFLFLPRTAFVIAADEDMVRHAVKEHYSGPTERHVSDYLDKLIQIPVRVPRLGVQETVAYLFMLFASARQLPAPKLGKLQAHLEAALQASWKQEQPGVAEALKAVGEEENRELKTEFEAAERLAPILASAQKVQGNPRIVKRLLNTVRMRTKLANRRNMPLDETLIAKLALFERCTDENAYSHLCLQINDSRDGQPKIIEKMEALKEQPQELSEACPEAWRKHQAFLADWLTLEPQLSGIDLRAAVYLSREIAPLRGTRAGMSASAMDCFKTLLVTKKKVSRAARDAVSATDPGEHMLVMEALISEMRRTTSWDSRPPGLVGATVLAEVSTPGRALLYEFLRGLQLKPQPLWMQSMLKSEQ